MAGTTVGTATIAVVPSMDGFSKAVSSGLGSSMSKAGLSAGKASGASAGSGFTSGMAAKMGAVAGAVGTAANAALSAVSGSIGSAISRVDTLNQFPKTMQQMGFSAKEAEASISKMSNGIDGLPTSLDEITSNAQSIALLTGDLDGATDTALALNNAFLASGSSSADASRGLTQYTQMLSKGTVDMQSWRTLQETMGYALRETAAAMGYTGKSATNDLYAALQSGKVTFDDFNAKLTELNAGTDGFAETAKTASVGIGTSFQNLQTAVTKNLANIVDAFNGDGGINGALDSAKEAVNGLGEALVPMAEQAGEALSGLGESVSSAFGEEGLAGAASALTDGLGEMIGDALQGIGDAVAECAPQLMQAAYDMFVGLVDGIAEAIPAIVDGFAGMVDSLCEFLDGEGGGEMDTAWADALGKLALSVAKALPKVLAALLKLVVSAAGFIIRNAPKLLAAGKDIFGKLAEAAGAVKDKVVNKVKSVIAGAVSAVKDKVASMADAGRQLIAGIWQGLSDKAQWLYDQVTGLGKGVVDKVKSLFGIHSPSRVMRGLFRYVGEGMALGLKDSAAGVVAAAAGVAGSVTSALSVGAPALAGGTYSVDTTYRAYAPAASHAASSGNVTVNLNYSSDADANQMARDIASALRRVQMGGN